MKFNKKHLVAELAILLGVASISTVGLSAYIIAGGKQEATPTTSKPTPVTITNNVVDLTATISEGDALVLQPLVQVSEGIMTTDGEGDLSVAVDITIKAESKDKFKDKKITVAVTPNQSSTDIGTYVVAPTTKEIAYSEFVGSTGTFTKQVVLEWTWGSAFGNTDPCAWANNVESIETITKTMNLFKTAVDNVTNYTVTVSLVDAKA